MQFHTLFLLGSEQRTLQVGGGSLPGLSGNTLARRLLNPSGVCTLRRRGTHCQSQRHRSLKLLTYGQHQIAKRWLSLPGSTHRHTSSLGRRNIEIFVGTASDCADMQTSTRSVDSADAASIGDPHSQFSEEIWADHRYLISVFLFEICSTNTIFFWPRSRDSAATGTAGRIFIFYFSTTR